MEPENDDAEARIAAALEAYDRLLNASRTPDRKEFLKGYPEIRDQLEPLLESVELVHLAGQQFGTGFNAAYLQQALLFLNVAV